METVPKLTPLLVVHGAPRAIDFYVRALGAKVLARYEHGAARHIGHADLVIGKARFAVTEEARAFNSDAPSSLGGSPVVLQLRVADADVVVASMRAAGATVVFPVQELLGERMARIQDPFGHLWIVRQRLENLSVDEIRRQRDALFARFAAEASAPARLEEDSRLDDFPATPQEPGEAARSGRESSGFAAGRATRDARAHLVTGPVGAGKSTFALRLASERGALCLTLDEWMTHLFAQDRPDEGVLDWYVARTIRCVKQIWSIAERVLEIGTDVVLEIGLLQRRERESFYRRVDGADFRWTLYVLDAPREVRRKRVTERNRTMGPTFSMVVPPAIFELASDRWEPPDPRECDGRDVRFLWTNDG
jgi:uncharacterized glyoxalase superfamily protein PhnB/predicted kinase